MMARLTAAIAALLLAPALALAQQTSSPNGQRPAMKRGLPVVVSAPACRPSPAPKPASDAQQRAARDLALRAQQSAILGDRAAARDQLKGAATLDPANPELAYQLARAQEAAGSSDDAAAEYCRFLSLAPNAPEASEAKDRVAALSRTAQASVSDRILAPFRAGIAAYESGRMPQAEASFTSAIKLQPDWADAYYDRSLTYSARGEYELAARDLQQYLRYKPEAEDRAAIIARITTLRGGGLSPAAALGYGIIIPGAGQFYTKRAVFGVVTLGAAGGAIAYAMQSGPVTEHYTETGTLPFGGTYTYPATREVQGKPHLAQGAAIAGAIALSSAIEAYIYARHSNSREPRFSAALEPSTQGLELRLTLR